MLTSNSSPGRLVVVGAGMVAHRFVESVTARDADHRWSITVLGDEKHGPYDRVGLTGYFAGKTVEDLALDPRVLAHERVGVRTGARVTRIDREKNEVATADGATHGYDRLVLATGSFAARLALDGFDHEGCFVYRTSTMSKASGPGWPDAAPSSAAPYAARWSVGVCSGSRPREPCRLRASPPSSSNRTSV